MKLILLVGPQGSGKTFFCENKLPVSFHHVSQDEFGKEGHIKRFEELLNEGLDIVIDRINHTKEQRARYLSKAKEHGYETEIREFFSEYKVCYERIINRKNHPTIKTGDHVTAKKALDMYFNQYEPILDNEADVISRRTRNPVMMDLTELSPPGRVFVVGDLHGCYLELQRLLRKVNFDYFDDVLISAGDLVDRGPMIDKVLREFIENTNFYFVQGNHDNKFIRYLAGNKVNTESLKETIAQVQATDLLNEKELYFDMKDVPYIIKYGNNLITHAGFFPENPMNTSREFSLYARKYDPAMRTFTNNDTQPYWYKFLPEDNTLNLYFGHEIHEDDWNPHSNVFALDGGCYKGGKLRMAEIDLNGFVCMHEVDSDMPKIEADKEWDHMNKFEPYDKLVEQKLLNKQENGDLVLYNYGDQVTYQKHWNKYTIESRGLILNKITGDTVARPFPKFWNLSELINVEDLKKEDDKN